MIYFIYSLLTTFYTMCQVQKIEVNSCTVVAESENGYLHIACPFTNEAGISDVLSQITVYKQIYTPQSTPAMASIDRVSIISISRSVGLNPVYTIKLDPSAEDTNYQVVFHGAKYQEHEPPMGYGGANPVGDLG